MNRRQILRALGVGAGIAPLVPALNGWASPATAPAPAVARVQLERHGARAVLARRHRQGDRRSRRAATSSRSSPSRRTSSSTATCGARSHKLGGAHERAMGALWTGCRLNPGSQFGGGGWPNGPSVDQIIVREACPRAPTSRRWRWGCSRSAPGPRAGPCSTCATPAPTSPSPRRGTPTSCSTACSAACRWATRPASIGSAPSAAASSTWSAASWRPWRARSAPPTGRRSTRTSRRCAPSSAGWTAVRPRAA